ncbi:MAG: F0F1 ATP synthase subunit delta [Syntrophomonadaceae bacterium]|jgi:F-type H+-transporting ATPase subunit delta|nr:F0F1 ATP synthase subunit delta [Syntrophomonadaceae bacterium]MDH7497519.1 F0F1 ATP synthase subunit delta [Syntrophomonadaceae bacterium]
MLNKSVARRYAEALFAIAQDTQKVDEYQKELEMVAEVVGGNEDLKAFMFHPLVPPKEKKDVVAKLFGDKLSPVTTNFVNVVVDKRREIYLAAIAEEFKQMANEFKNVLFADLVSAREVPDPEIEALKSRLAEATGKTVELKVSVDPALIGGIKVRVGDRIIDASVRKKLDMLKDSLKKTRVS